MKLSLKIAVWILAIHVGWGILPFTQGLSPASAQDDPLILVAFEDHPPYHTMDSNDNLYGFDVDLAQAIGVQLQRKVVVRWAPKDQVIDLVLEGKADGVIGITESYEGKKIFDYTQPYLTHKTRLFIREGTEFILRLTDLRGLRIGVRSGVDVENYLKIVPGLTLVSEPSAEAGLKNLVNRVTNAYIGDEYECDYAIQRNRFRGITTFGGAILARKRTIAVKKGNTKLLESLNPALENLAEDLTIQTLEDEWLTRRIVWAGSGRWSLFLLLSLLGVIACVLLVTVIWNHKLAEAVEDRTREVQSEHEHFENIFKYASDGIVVLNPETMEVVQSNKAFEEILGYEQEELQKMVLSDLDSTAEKSFSSQIHRVFASGENILFEARLVNKSQEPVDLFIHAQTFPYKGERMVEAIARDITQQKKLEAMKDTILQDVAHELKTPMAKLSMSLELLEKKFPREKKDVAEKHFDVCNRAMVRLQNTIEGILNLSRLEARAPKVEMESIELREVMQNVIQELQIFADRKGIQLVNRMTKTQISIRGDTEMIRRLFINLVHNAIKFTQQGAVTLSLEADEQFAKATVQDTGIGMEREDLTKIFGRFYQKTAAYEGSGVGLTICEKIVTFHSGVIWAESEGIGTGASIRVLFPLHRPKEDKK